MLYIGIDTRRRVMARLRDRDKYRARDRGGYDESLSESEESSFFFLLFFFFLLSFAVGPGRDEREDGGRHSEEINGMAMGMPLSPQGPQETKSDIAYMHGYGASNEVGIGPCWDVGIGPVAGQRGG